MTEDKKNDQGRPKSAGDRIKETIQNTQATPTDGFGKKLKTGKRQLDPLNGPHKYH